MLKPLFTALHSRPLHHSVRFYRPSRLNFSTADTIALETKEIIDKCIHSIRTSKTKFNQIAPLIKLLTAPNTYNYIFDKLEPDLTNLVHTYEGLQLTNNIIKKASKAHIDRLLVQFQDNIALCSHTKLASFAMQNLSKKLCTKSQMDVFGKAVPLIIKGLPFFPYSSGDFGLF